MRLWYGSWNYVGVANGWDRFIVKDTQDDLQSSRLKA